MKADRGMRIRIGEKVGRWLPAAGIALIAALLPGVCAQNPAPKALAFRSAVLVANLQAPVRAIREFRDPHTGLTWLVVRDAKNPAGPGRIVAGDPVSVQDGMGPKRILIRAGDRVVVEEHGPAVEASLEAIALETASAGSRFKVRLRIGGKVVGVVALAPGRAALAHSWEGRQ